VETVIIDTEFFKKNITESKSVIFFSFSTDKNFKINELNNCL